MADFCITAVNYSKDGKHIEWVQVREVITEPTRVLIGYPRAVERAFVADLIRLGKAKFQTRFLNADKKWAVGADIHVIETTYLTTDRNSTERDNLGSLPEFKL